MKKCVMSAVMALMIAAAAFAGQAEAATTLRLGHVVADNSSLDKGLDYFAKLVSDKSNGELKIQVFPNSSLGDNTAMMEQLQFGSLDLMAPSVAALSGFTPSTAIFDLPYLFKNEAAAEEVLDGPLGDTVGKALEPQGFYLLGWMTQSWRHLTCNKEVTKPADVAGIKIRTMDSKYHMAHFNTLGASAIPMAMSELYTALQQGTIDAQENPYTKIPMAMSELYTALQQGTIDAQENPYTNIVNSRFYEVQKYVVETGHIYDACPLIISTITWKRLDDNQKKIIQEAAAEAVNWERAEVKKDDAVFREQVKKSGTTVIVLTPEQRAEFRKAAQPVYDEFVKEQGQAGADAVKSVEAVNAKH